MSEIKIDLNRLKEAHIIDSDTKIKIEQFVLHHRREESNKKILSTFTTLGSIITGIGILLFVAANWQNMNNIIKTLFLIVSTLAFYGAGFFYAYKKTGYEKTGESLIFLGAVTYGASIFLLNQIYHIGGDISANLLIWAIGILPLAYNTKFSTLFTLGISTLYLSIIIFFGENYTINPIMYALSFMVLGFASLTLVRHHTGKYKFFGTILTFLGSSVILGSMLLLTFSDFWNGGFWSQEGDNTLYAFLFAGLIFGGAAILTHSWKTKKINFREEFPFLLGFIALIGLMIISLQTLPSYEYENRSFFFPLPFPFSLYVFIMNILFFTLISILIYRGIQKDKPILVNISIFFFAVYLFGKYIMFAVDSKFGGAFVFITGGLVCIALGWFAENIRRRILHKIK